MLIQGRATIIQKLDDYKRIKKGDILIARNTLPEIVVYQSRLSAIVVEVDNKLCHAAIIAREFGIPLLMGVADATKTYKDGDKVAVDIERKIICLN